MPHINGHRAFKEVFFEGKWIPFLGCAESQSAYSDWKTMCGYKFKYLGYSHRARFDGQETKCNKLMHYWIKDI